MRNMTNQYPDYSAELERIKEIGTLQDGIPHELLERIISKHGMNSVYNKELYNRYKMLEEDVPIFNRKPKFDDDTDPNKVKKAPKINNKIGNDFIGEIVDFKVGYFAGKAISYSYSSTEESEEDTGGNEALLVAKKALSDFVTRNNMYDVDMEITKYASICGYAGRLFYIDTDGEERAMAVAPFETIVLCNTNITEPEFAVRYYTTTDINDREIVKAEFYDDKYIYFYEGQANSMTFKGKRPHMFDYCPLQGVPNNNEMIGDAEKVLSAIDNYDTTISDASNDIEAFASAYMVFENINIDEQTMHKCQATGAIKFFNPSGVGKVYYLTKDVNDTVIQNHLDRLEDNIYRFSKTPNLTDETFGSASGVSLKFKLTGLETKCGMFQAKMMSAGVYMFKLLASSWRKKKIAFDPLQCVMDFKRNFPLDVVNEAQAAQALINAGVPPRVAYTVLSFIDDIDWLMDLIEEEKDNIPSLDYDDGEEDDVEEESKLPLYEV